MGREREGPKKFLRGYSGILQTADYKGYDRDLLALLHDDKQRKGNQHTNERINSEVRASEVDEEVIESVEDKVARLTIALAPVLLPMIESLGALDIEAAETVSASGEAT